jgi:hypothetical protein
MKAKLPLQFAQQLKAFLVKLLVVRLLPGIVTAWAQEEKHLVILCRPLREWCSAGSVVMTFGQF